MRQNSKSLLSNLLPGIEKSSFALYLKFVLANANSKQWLEILKTSNLYVTKQFLA